MTGFRATVYMCIDKRQQHPCHVHGVQLSNNIIGFTRNQGRPLNVKLGARCAMGKVEGSQIKKIGDALIFLLKSPPSFIIIWCN